MKRLVGFLLFLVFVQDWGAHYYNHLGAPMAWVHDYLLAPTPISIRPFDLIMLVVLVIGSQKNKGAGAGSVGPMKNTLLLIVATTVLWFGYGLVHGGDAHSASWQIYLIFSTVLLAFTVAATFRTAADFSGLGKWLVAAAVYRALMCWISYFTWARDVVGESGAYLTSHDDTVTWVVSILVLVVNAVSAKSRSVAIRNSLIILFLLGAIQFNSRRLAWVSLAMGLAVLYFLFPEGVAKRRVKRVARILAPIVLVYVAVGWGRQSPIFLPLRSLSSVSTQEDSSTLARNAENLGLIATASGANFALGTGWGLPYMWLTLKYDISGFELWRYIPHNSILGLLAFTGIVGFAGFWLALPTAVFLCSRVVRLAPDQTAKNVALVGASELVVSANHLYGDMGIFSLQAMYVIAISYAIALRLPRATGVWSLPRRKAAPPGPASVARAA